VWARGKFFPDARGTGRCLLRSSFTPAGFPSVRRLCPCRDSRTPSRPLVDVVRRERRGVRAGPSFAASDDASRITVVEDFLRGLPAPAPDEKRCPSRGEIVLRRRRRPGDPQGRRPGWPATPSIKRTLQRLFSRSMSGVSPKWVIQRYRPARGRRANWRRGRPSISHRSPPGTWGYTDQAHFVHDFKNRGGDLAGGGMPEWRDVSRR